MTPANQLQPKTRLMRYDNVHAARAEEGIIRLLILDSGFYRRLDGLTGDAFSSPVLGKVYTLLYSRAKDGLSTALGTLAPHLTAEEMSHMVQVLDEPVSMASADGAIADYIAIIQEEAAKRAGTDDALLLAAQKRNREKKAYLEERT